MYIESVINAKFFCRQSLHIVGYIKELFADIEFLQSFFDEFNMIEMNERRITYF